MVFEKFVQITFVWYWPGLVVMQQVVAHRFRLKPATIYRDRRASWVLRISGVGLAALYASGVHVTAQSIPVAVRIVGFPLMVGGFWLTYRSQSELGRNWIPRIGVRQGHKLVTTGPYAYMRNPLYAGIGLGAIGSALITADLLASVGVLLFWSSMLVRIPYEEAVMQQRFKRRYEEYYSVTPGLIPRLFRRRSS